jgi:hypothetical protein
VSKVISRPVRRCKEKKAVCRPSWGPFYGPDTLGRQCGKKKKGDLQQVAFQKNGPGRSGAAGPFGTAAGAPGAKVDTAVQLEAILLEIHLDGFGFFHEFRVDDEFESVNVKCRVRVGKLIQSHGQAGTPSAAFVEKNADRFDIFSLEVFGNLLNCRLCDLEHNTLLGYKKSVMNDSGPETAKWFQPWNLTMSIRFVNPNSRCYRSGI